MRLSPKESRSRRSLSSPIVIQLHGQVAVLSGIGVSSLDALPDIREALLRFRKRAAEGVAKADESIRRFDARIAEHHDRLMRKVRYLEHVREHADESHERMKAEDDLEEAIEELNDHEARTEAWNETVDAYKRERQRVLQFVEHTTPAACEFLTRKHSELEAYLAVLPPFGGANPGSVGSGLARQPEGMVTEESAVPRPSIAQAAMPGPAEATLESLPALPTGLRWIPIASIALSDLPPIDDYKKVPYAEMRRGLQLLWTEMLPLLAQNPGAGREIFERWDREHRRIDRMGGVHPESLAHLWDKFFTRKYSEHIRVTSQGSDTRLAVDNGRHRIRVARDLGWKFIPGEWVEARKIG